MSVFFLTTYPAVKNLERVRVRALQEELLFLAVENYDNLVFFTMLRVVDLAVSIVMDYDPTHDSV